jgi:hypothetical protein
VGPLQLTVGCIGCAALVLILERYPPVGLVFRVGDRYPDRASMGGSWEAQVRNDSDLSVHRALVLELKLEVELGD